MLRDEIIRLRAEQVAFFADCVKHGYYTGQVIALIALLDKLLALPPVVEISVEDAEAIKRILRADENYCEMADMVEAAIQLAKEATNG